jgi:zinc/manganese transport system ATP-binding protein
MPDAVLKAPAPEAQDLKARAPLASPGHPRPGKTVLAVEGLSVRLGGRDVLRQVSFSVAGGELTGLIGANGAGKTTLIRAVLGLQVVSAGSIQRGSVGYVPQKVVLDPDLPVRARDLVSLGVDGERLGTGWRSRRRQARVGELLAAVGASQFSEARVGRLSGGEQQRVLIAHALASEPELLLLDEPLANLDPASTQAIVKLLAEIAASRRMGVLLSTHDINPLLPFMHRVVYLAGGLAASGTTEEVVRSDVLSALYGHHVDVLRAHGRVIVSVADEHREEGCEAPEEGDFVLHAQEMSEPLSPRASTPSKPAAANELDTGCELLPED